METSPKHRTRWNADDANDPLLKKLTRSRVEMAKQVGQVLDGASADDVVNVLASSMLNLLRQVHPKRRNAEEALRHLHHCMQQDMDRHYHAGPNGKRRSVFPFDQDIAVPHLGKLGN